MKKIISLVLVTLLLVASLTVFVSCGEKSKEQLVVATNAAFAPFEYKEGDSYYGVDMEIMSMYAESVGKELVIDNMDFDSVCTSVGQGLCNVAAAGLTINETREKILDFSDSYYNASQMIIVKADDTTFDACATVADVEAILNGYDATVGVGVQAGTTGFYYCKGDADWGFDGFKFDTKSYNNAALAVQDMINGNIKYVVVDEAPAKRIAQSQNVKVIDIKLTDEQYAFAVKKGDAELLASINKYLADIKANGEFEKILDKYFGSGTPTAITSAVKK